MFHGRKIYVSPDRNAGDLPSICFAVAMLPLVADLPEEIAVP